MIPPTMTTGEVIPDDEFQIEKILKHTPKFDNLKHATYTVKWMKSKGSSLEISISFSIKLCPTLATLINLAEKYLKN